MNLYKETILTPEMIVVPEGYIKPTELIEWKRFEDEKPKENVGFPYKDKFGNISNNYGFYTKSIDDPVDLWKGCKWCYASTYEEAQRKEQLVGVLGDGWKRHGKLLFTKDNISIEFCDPCINIMYFHCATIPIELATIHIVKELIEQIIKTQ